MPPLRVAVVHKHIALAGESRLDTALVGCSERDRYDGRVNSVQFSSDFFGKLLIVRGAVQKSFFMLGYMRFLCRNRVN